jgi:hypothetical protein
VARIAAYRRVHSAEIADGAAPDFTPRCPRNRAARASELQPDFPPRGKRQAKERVDRQKADLEKEQAAGRDALAALKKMQARVRAGVSYRDYSSHVADAKFAVESFIDSPIGKKRPELVFAMRSALLDYETAGSVWNLKVSSGRVSNFVIHRDIDQQLMAKYPAMTQAVDIGSIRIDYALPIIWSSATERIEEATKMLGE